MSAIIGDAGLAANGFGLQSDGSLP
jgi:hypothetical protein